MEKTIAEFDYKLFAKGEIAIVSFMGKMNKESRDKMAVCQEELLKGKVSMVILFFRDVTNIDFNILRELTLFQHEIRQKKTKLFITGLNAPLRQLLDDKGVIRLNEVKSSLEEVLLQAV